MSWKIKIALGFAALLALIFLFLVEEHFRGAWGLSRLKSRMAAKGEPMTIPAATPPGCSQNEDGMPALMGAAGQASYLDQKLRPPAALYAVPAKVIVITRVSQWPKSGRPKTNITWTVVGEAIQKQEAALSNALKALEYEKYDPHLNYYSGWSTRLPHLSQLQRLGFWFSAAALEAFHRGDADKGIEYTEAAIHLGAALKNEPLVISQRVRMTLAERAFATTWQAAHGEGVQDHHLKRLQEAWGKQDFLAHMKPALSMEHVITSHEFDRFKREDIALDQWLGVSGSAMPPVAINSPSTLLVAMIEHTPEFLRNGVYTPTWKFAWWHQDQLRCLENVERALSAWNAAMVQQCVRPIAIMGGSEELLMDWDDDDVKQQNFYDRIRYVVSPKFGKSGAPMQRAFGVQTLRELVVTGLALQRYRLRVGKSPERLEELVPEFVPKLPRDFMSGGTLQYRQGLLYSVGADGEDGGGNVGTTNVHGFAILEGKDFVWPREASPEEVKARFEAGGD